MKKNKKAVELPISMIIVLILSILVFSFGITILFKSYKWATQQGGEIDAATQREIERVLLEGNNVIALPKNTARARVGQQVPFGLGIRNILPDKNEFAITISFSGAYTAADAPITEATATTVEDEWLGNLRQQQNIKIDGYGQKITPLTIKIGNYISTSTRTQKGTYVFNACVFKQANAQTSCPPNIDATLLYGGQIHQVTVIV